jgi:hypothetical protein
MEESVLLYRWGVGVPGRIGAIGEAGSLSFRGRSWLLAFTELALENIIIIISSFFFFLCSPWAVLTIFFVQWTSLGGGLPRGKRKR